MASVLSLIFSAFPSDHTDGHRSSNTGDRQLIAEQEYLLMKLSTELVFEVNERCIHT